MHAWHAVHQAWVIMHPKSVPSRHSSAQGTQSHSKACRFQRDEYEQKTPTFENTEYKRTSHRENPGNRLTPSRWKKNLSARHAWHTARIAQKPRRLRPDGLPLSTVLAFVRTVRLRRDMSENAYFFHINNRSIDIHSWYVNRLAL